MPIKSGNIFIVEALTGHKTLAMGKRYVKVTAKDVSNFMHAPEPAPQASQPQASRPAGAMTQETLQAAMQMLQAAAAQLNVQTAAAAPGPVHAPARSAANDDGGVGAFA